ETASEKHDFSQVFPGFFYYLNFHTKKFAILNNVSMMQMLFSLVKDVPKRLYWLRSNDPVPEDLRGWSYHTYPVRPRAYFGLGVSEVAYKYCETFRDLWMRRKEYVRAEVLESSPLYMGKLIHSLMNYAFRDASEIVSRNLGPLESIRRAQELSRKRASELTKSYYRKAMEFYMTMVLSAISTLWIQQSLTNDPLSYISIKTEFVIDGTPVGLSNTLRVDAYHEGGVIIEYKLGNPDPLLTERHSVGLAGYALAIESSLDIPIDYGAIVYISELSRRPSIKVFPVYISSLYRKKFLENRDEAIEVLMRATPPPRSGNCYQYCPFFKACNGGERS
ncbi:MAG: type I-A CRISPR-associated protein Cas4/Csa1, partial [Fervidicoccaceae archaeon]